MKRWKRIFSILLAAALVSTQPGGLVLAGAVGRGASAAAGAITSVVQSVEAIAAVEQVTYTDASGWSVSFDKNTGTILAFDNGTSNATEIILPSAIEQVPVTRIGEYAFQNERPSSGDWLRIVIPEGVNEICDGAFWVTNTKAIELPASLKIIGPNAFRGSHVEKIAIPEGVTQIGNYAWYDSGLKQVELLSKAAFGEAVFGHCDLGDLELPGWMTDIGKAFRDCSMTSLTLAAGTTSIPEGALYGCRSLQTVANMEQVTSIGAQAFYNCEALTGIDLQSVESLGEEAFYNCNKLERIVLPASLAVIPKGAFKSLDNLKTVTLPNGLQRIEEGAFEECGNLESITLPEGLSSIGKRAFSSSGLKSIAIPEGVVTLGEEVFASCRSLTGVTLPSTLTEISTKAFQNTGLTSIAVPQSVTAIGDYAFDDCTKLSQITLAEGLESVGAYAFQYTNGLTSISFPSTVKNIGQYAFWQSGVTEITIPSAMTTVSDYAFAVSNIRKVIFHDGVTAIGAGAFLESDLQSIDFPTNLKTVGDEAFQNTPLTSITVPAGVKFGSGAFAGSSELTQVGFESGVTEVAVQMFDGCNKLVSIAIPEGVTAIGAGAFNECNGLAGVTLPKSLKAIGSGAFNSCDLLSGVQLPDSLERVESNAFYGCGLTEITLPASLQYVGKSAFYCFQLANTYVYGMDTEFDRYAFLRDDGSNFNMWANNEMIMHGYVGSTAETYMKTYGDADRFQPFIEQALTLTANVVDASGEEITSGFAVYWYRDDSRLNTNSSLTLSGVEENTVYECEVVLDDELLGQYRQPARQSIKVEEASATLTITLEKIQTVTVTGRVTDADGKAISGAQIRLEQAGSVTTGADGRFSSAEVPAEKVLLQISKDGYYSKELLLSLSDAGGEEAYDAGTVILYQAVSDRLNLSLSVRHAAAEGQEARVETWSSANGLDIKLTSGGQDVSTENYEVQGSTIVFQPSVVQAGQEIRVNISDSAGRLVPASGAVTLNGDKMGSLALELQEKGSFQLGEIIMQGQSNVMVFDGEGRYLATYNAQTGMQSDPMDAGNCTLVFIRNSNMLKSVPDLSVLDNLGLRQGEDYARRDIAIADGVLVEVGGVTVPDLAEDAFTYLESGSLGASTVRPAQGTLVLMTAHFDLAEGYQAQNVQIHIPQSMNLTGQVTVDNQAGTLTNEDGILTIPVQGKESATIHFYLMVQETGSSGVSAYVELTNRALQPLGTMTLETAQAKITAPEHTASEKIVVTGTAIPLSTILLYDNGTKIGETRANAVGSWVCEAELAEPLYNYSYHNIHAEIVFQNTAIPTDEKTVIYDTSSIDLTKITMYTTNHITGESAAVLDFTKPQTVKPYYYYWPGHMDYTFKVEFNKDATSLSEVNVVATGSNGERIRIPAAYDTETGAWLASYDFDGDSPPVAIGAEYEDGADLDLQVSAQAFLDAARQYENAVGQATDQLDIVYAGDGSETVDDDTLSYQFVEANLEEEKLVMNLLFPGSDGENKVLCRYTLQRTDDDRTGEALQDAGYNLIPGKNVYVKFGAEGLRLRTEYVDVTDQSCLSETYDLGGASASALSKATALSDDRIARISTADWEIYQYYSDYIIGKLTEVPAYGEFASLTSGLLNTGSQQINWRRELNGNYEALKELLDSVEVALNATCPDGSRRIAPDLAARLFEAYYALCDEVGDYKENGLQMINASLGLPLIEKAITKIVQKTVSRVGFGVIDQWISDKYGQQMEDAQDMLELKDMAEELLGEKIELGAAMENVEAFLDAGSLTDFVTSKVLNRFVTQSADGYVIDVNFGTWSVKFYTEQGIENYLNTGFQEYYDRIMDLKSAVIRNYVQCPGPKPDKDMMWDDSELNDREVSPIYDPSGYVYEAVPSNRLEGVTAKVYYQNDNKGYEWDAGHYDQSNPQTTDASGMFAWFVPDGKWKVEFTKEGYESTDSSDVLAAASDGGWLPVPPPQFEVNVGMVSEAAPTVEQVIAYNDRIEVVFSQYMDIDSVKDAIKLSRDRVDVTVTVTPLDAEYAADGKTQYATRFSVIPADSNCAGTIVVSTGAKNYAENVLVKQHIKVLEDPVMRPTGIVASEPVSVACHASASLALTLQPGVAGRTLTVENLTNSLLSVIDEEVVTGENGVATLMLSGRLPGEGVIRITEPGSGLSETVSVKVVQEEDTAPDEPEQEKPASVVATLVNGTVITSGMTLEKGTQVMLSTATNGAAIRYTLDDTCPCKEPALTYNTPIVITEDTVLRAAACKDGIYSETIRLELKVKEEGHERPAGNSGNGSGGTTTSSRPQASVSGEGGSVSVSESGMVAITPDTGYQVGSVTVNGETVDIPADGKLSGLDKDDKVVVTFERIPDTTDLPFTDVASSDWYREAVKYVYEQGMMNGTSDTSFSPNETTTRAMIVTILHRLENEPSASAFGFTDVVSDAYYENAVNWAAANGIVNGISETGFAPNTAITREQMAATLYRYAQFKGYDVTASNDLSSYTDASQISAYATTAMQWANAEGLITGNTDTTINPTGNATRAEVATILMRFCENIAK
nr:leucine-rich repeat protein [uncultured Agathobaculum sp.]